MLRKFDKMPEKCKGGIKKVSRNNITHLLRALACHQHVFFNSESPKPSASAKSAHVQTP